MRNKKLVIIVLLLLPTLWYGCTKTDDGSYTAPITVYEKVHGTWQLLSIKLVDETAKSAGISPQEVDLTNELNFTSFAITLNVDGNMNATTYSVSGDVPELLQPSGYWKLDSDFPMTDGTPVKINLYSDAAKTQKTNELSITSPASQANSTSPVKMEFKLTHTSNQVAYASYVYSLYLVQESK